MPVLALVALVGALAFVTALSLLAHYGVFAHLAAFAMGALWAATTLPLLAYNFYSVHGGVDACVLASGDARVSPNSVLEMRRRSATGPFVSASASPIK